ncbi:MAG: C25 family cysteine peptidase [Candidatus Ratteibacteria bacterium]|nr:C25 family cysteine peptidase [Candidatus Ratteibacteria bacterium]
MKRRLFFVVLVLSILWGFSGLGYASGKTFYIPKDFATLQEAINAAENGDTIEVAEGTYKGNINFKGKSITLTSDSANTVIEGTEEGSVVTIDSNAIIRGFTITSGDIDCRGIYIIKASPTIENCTITDNEAGGIYSTDDSSSKIINCVIIENGRTNQVYGGTLQISFSFIGDKGLVNTTETTAQQTTATAEITTTEEPQPPTTPNETPPVIKNVHKIGRTEWVKEGNILHTSLGETAATLEGIKAIQSANVSCSLEVAFKSPSFGKKDSYDKFNVPELDTWHGTAGAPILPFKPMRILIPYGQKVTKVKVIPGLKQEISGKYIIEPVQKQVPINQIENAGPTPPNPVIYESDDPYPSVPCGDAFLQGKSGYAILIVNLFPVEYHPKSRKLFYYPDMTVEVETAPLSETTVHLLGTSAKGASVSSANPDPRIKDEINSMVDNPEVIKTYETSAGFTTLSGSDYEYIVITTNALRDAGTSPYKLDDLVNAKISRGITAAVVTVENEISLYPDTRPDGGHDVQTQIRNFIIDYSQNHGTRYVLLAGNASNIPPRMFWVDPLNPYYSPTLMPVDMYYGCLLDAYGNPVTFDDEPTPDGVYGEPNDGPGGGEVDLYAEVFVGRAPVATGDEISNFVRKTLTYENTTSDYLRSIYMVGELLDYLGQYYGSDYMEEIRLGSDANGYTTIGFENSLYADFFDTYTLYDDYYNYISTQDLIDAFNSGAHIINHLGHGEWCCMCYYIPFCTYELQSLTNTDYSFVYSQTCEAGRFDDYSDCFAEVVTTMQYGAFAAIMNARYGWYDPGGTDGASQCYHREFWDAFLGENINKLGKINQDSKEDNISKINAEFMRWSYYELNLFGDPELILKGAERRWYVDADAPLGGNGETWETAFKYLQDALAVAGEHEEIRVAQGTYKPDQAETTIIELGDRTDTFQLIDGVTVKGGYAGYYNPPPGASAPNERDITNYQTILSGDLDNNDLANFVNYDNNSYHVVTGANNGTVEGFIIEHGNADDGAVEDPWNDWLPGGSGMYNENCSPIVNNCTFRNNMTDEKCGAAISNSDSSSPQITNCAFINNRAVRGGAIFTFESQQIVNNCTFADNFAHIWGGAIDCLFSQSEIANCIFSNNTARYGGAIGNRTESSMDITNCVFFANTVSLPGGTGGALNNHYAEITITNCTFTQNYAAYRGGAIYNRGGEPLTSAALTNCILWGNTDYMAGTDEILYDPNGLTPSPIVISHCDIKNSGGSANGHNWTIYFGIDAGGNIDSDPLFINPENPLSHGLRLEEISPCIDAANGDTAPLTDILGQERVDIPGIPNATSIPADMGAYEKRFAVIWYVDNNTKPGGDGKTWETAFKYLQDALNNPSLEPEASDEIWVAGGAYKPDQGNGIAFGDRTATFRLITGVTIKGGYKGGDNSTGNERSIKTYQTILSGDLADNDGTPPNFANYGDNSYHVITAIGTDNTAILDGFTITGGNATGSSENAFGGGLYNRGTQAGSPTITNCIFSYNRATFGGGVYNGCFPDSPPRQLNRKTILTNCIFDHNTSTEGGAINGGLLKITNCVFTHNTADANGRFGYGGAIAGGDGETINCTFYGNTAVTHGGAICTGVRSMTITNSIFWGNSNDIVGSPFVNYCDVENPTTIGDNRWKKGTGNISANPLFINADNPAGADGILGTLDDGLRLSEDGPCVGAAYPAIAPSTDILGFNRDEPDMGAYEQVTTYITAVVSGGQIHISTDCGETWEAKESNRDWRGIAMSFTGQYQTATVFRGYIYVSSDYGKTWEARMTDSNRDWWSVAMSSNGQYQTTMVRNTGQIYISSDYGNTWTPKESNRYWEDIAMSSNGQYQTAVNYGRGIYVSADYGNTWVLTGDYNFGIAMSSDGSHQTAIYDGRSSIYVSEDYGNTWVPKGPDTLPWLSVAMSSDGSRQTAGPAYEPPYISVDYGNTWVPTTVIDEGYSPENYWWRDIAMCSDGLRQAVTAGNNRIYISFDYGNTWVPKGPEMNWKDIAISH